MQFTASHDFYNPQSFIDVWTFNEHRSPIRKFGGDRASRFCAPLKHFIELNIPIRMPLHAVTSRTKRLSIEPIEYPSNTNYIQIKIFKFIQMDHHCDRRIPFDEFPRSLTSTILADGKYRRTVFTFEWLNRKRIASIGDMF